MGAGEPMDGIGLSRLPGGNLQSFSWRDVMRKASIGADFPNYETARRCRLCSRQLATLRIGNGVRRVQKVKFTERVNTGAPLLEQDAEFLKELLVRHGVAAIIQRSEDEAEIASGSCYLVQVPVRHQARARQLRAQFFSDRMPTGKAGTPRWSKRELIGAGAAAGGCLLGVPVALIFKGGAFMAVLAGGALSLSAMLMTLVLTVGSFGPPKAQNPGTQATHTQIAGRKEPTDRRRD